MEQKGVDTMRAGRIILLMTVSLSIPVASYSLGASVVYDPQRNVQSVMIANDEIQEAIEQTTQILQQLGMSSKMLEEYKKAMEKVSMVSEYIGRAEDILEIYNMIEETANLLIYGKDVIMDENYLDVNRKLRYINSLISLSTNNIEHLQQMIQRYTPGSKSAGNMDDGQREMMKMEDIDIAQANIQLMKSEIYEAQKQSQYSEYNKNIYMRTMKLLGGF